jgi:hypothetical protein
MNISLPDSKNSSSSQATQDVGRHTLFNDPSPFNELNGDNAGGFASMHPQQNPMRFL